METMQDVIDAGWEIRDGIIQDPGKFQAEAWYAPIVYDWYMNGDRGEEIADEGGNAAIYTLDDATRGQLALSGDIYALLFSESDQGFVYVSELTEGAYLDLVAEDAARETEEN